MKNKLPKKWQQGDGEYYYSYRKGEAFKLIVNRPYPGESWSWNIYSIDKLKAPDITKRYMEQRYQPTREKAIALCELAYKEIKEFHRQILT